MSKEENSHGWGFVTPDGHFQAIGSLTVQALEYVSKSLKELEQLLDEHVFNEEYEKCILIKNEIDKRKK